MKYLFQKQLGPFYLLFLLCLLGYSSYAQSNAYPEEQISFARENRPHSYYVTQAGLWWEVLQRDMKDEKSWYNYYRANRNAQGTANWSPDFVNEAPNLMLGDDIVELMGQHIPESFTYNFVRGSTAAVYPGEGEYLEKAYQMNPDFPGLLATVVTYATSTHNRSLRKEANEQWYEKKEIPVSLLSYAYNTLQSVGPDGILLTQHDNDTYPVWALQDVKGIRNDVWVINIDFLLFDGYRDSVFQQLGIPPFSLEEVNVSEYETNWTNVVQHFLGNYQGDRPVHIGLTVSEKWYQPFLEKLEIVGMTRTWEGQSKTNQNLYENKLLLDYLKVDLEYTTLLPKIQEINFNYLHYFDVVYDSLGPQERRFVREIAQKILTDGPDIEGKDYYRSRFKE